MALPMPGGGMPVPPTAGAPVPPGLGAPPGGPPGMGGQPPNLGGAAAPQGNPGNAAQAIMKVRSAVKLLEDALPSIPMGSPLHTKALSVIKTILEAIPDEDPNMAGPQGAMLLQLARQQSQNAPNAALAQLSGGAPGGQPPMMPAPQAQAA